MTLSLLRRAAPVLPGVVLLPPASVCHQAPKERGCSVLALQLMFRVGRTGLILPLLGQHSTFCIGVRQKKPLGTQIRLPPQLLLLNSHRAAPRQLHLPRPRVATRLITHPQGHVPPCLPSADAGSSFNCGGSSRRAGTCRAGGGFPTEEPPVFTTTACQSH